MLTTHRKYFSFFGVTEQLQKSQMTKNAKSTNQLTRSGSMATSYMIKSNEQTVTDQINDVQLKLYSVPLIYYELGIPLFAGY